MDKSDWGVHEHHCCMEHGCKYGTEDCPVILGETQQLYRCESCPPKITNNILTLDKFITLSNDGWKEWLETNTIDKVTITTDDGVKLHSLTTLQNELVDLNNKKILIENRLHSIQDSKSYIRSLKIDKLKKYKK